MTFVQNYSELRNLPAASLREVIRSGRYTGHTAGLAPGHLQANIVILPEAFAVDFMRFCQRNAKACPLVGVSDRASPMMHTLGGDIDIRTDVPSYRIYRDGAAQEEVSDIREFWRDDLVAFALGCSFTFERALMAEGIRLQHIERNITVPMYRTSVATEPAGPFRGGVVVSMRPIKRSDVERVTAISARYPFAHGGPLHVGAPEAIGIAALERPDWGEACAIAEDEVPVFWACGVTPQNAVLNARADICITHQPGCMLITDVDESQEVPVYRPANA
ncbi:putative hydro-lyase [Hoeflea poritis]|uniref:Putative hydro-lyase OOZ53_15280 n=1 Tax=Hoeflea poritis TaxID=2993659 RepID=A0ABT4VPT4_9HYPH|nr:putative hydro-lyase [Hoeflea poritis]MDA4846722.1 putative hydro-lyase [Hoeflea poritis]